CNRRGAPADRPAGLLRLDRATVSRPGRPHRARAQPDLIGPDPPVSPRKHGRDPIGPDQTRQDPIRPDPTRSDLIRPEPPAAPRRPPRGWSGSGAARSPTRTPPPASASG